MCSIIGSFDGKVLKKLIRLNQFRGNFSHSYTEIITDNNQLNAQVQAFGEFNYNIIDTDIEEIYKIAHTQAPTGGMIKDIERVHPISSGNNMLWHNGLITPRGIEYLQNILCTNETFDTKLLLDAVEKEGFGVLNFIEGLFSCIYLKDGRLYMFRTKHGKLFIDDDFSISSERFEGSKCINADTVYEFMPKEKHLLVVDKFKTVRFNFVIPGEL